MILGVITGYRLNDRFTRLGVDASSLPFKNDIMKRSEKILFILVLLLLVSLIIHIAVTVPVLLPGFFLFMLFLFVMPLTMGPKI